MGGGRRETRPERTVGCVMRCVKGSEEQLHRTLGNIYILRNSFSELREKALISDN